MNVLHDLINGARHKLSYHEVLNSDGSVRYVRPQSPSVVQRYSIRDLEVPAFAEDAFSAPHFPAGTEAGKYSGLPAIILQGSRAVAAGAKLIIMPNRDADAYVANGITAFPKQNARFDLIEAAEFAPVGDEQDVATSALPISRDLVDLNEICSFGFRVALTRAERNLYAEGHLSGATLASIALGLARLADRVLLDAIAATTPTAFTLANAAAAGFEFAEIRALIGSDAIGAEIGQDGTLRAAGVLAELTPDTAATFVGAFNRAAIAVLPEIALIAERTNVRDEMIVTCWASMQALLPRPDAFWTVGA